MATSGARPVLLAGCLIAAVGYLTLLPFVGNENYIFVAFQFLVSGFGIGLIVPSVTNATLSAVDAQYAGVASGMINASRQVGGLLGVAVMGLIIQRAGGGADAEALRWSIAFAGIALLAGAGLTFTSIDAKRIAQDSDASRRTGQSGNHASSQAGL